MTERADSVRVAHPLFQAERGGSTPTSALQLRVVEIDTALARDLNALWHSRLPIYQTGSCLFSRVSYAAIHAGLYYAVAIWTNPVARTLPQQSWLELRRFAISPEAPRNTASRMLAVMTRLIVKGFADIVRLVSYQDVEAHSGTIYKAAGWYVGGEHSGGSWCRPNSHNRSGTPRLRPDANDATGPKIRWERVIRPVVPVEEER